MQVATALDLVAFAINGVKLEAKLGGVCRIANDIKTKACIWVVRIKPKEALLPVG